MGSITAVGSLPTTMLNSNIHADIGFFESDVKGDLFTYFEGRIDEVKIFNRALSSDDIQEIFTNGTCKCEFIVIDLNQDCRINLLDFALLGDDWMVTIKPARLS